MSEFTAGVLFLAKDAGTVEQQLKNTKLKHLIRPLNERWMVFLPADMFLMDERTVTAIRQVSWGAPLLYFNNAEDHGWGYRLFNRGSEVEEFSVMYPFGDVLEDLYDDEDPAQDEAEGDEPVGNPEHFRAFCLPEETIHALGRVLTRWDDDEEDPWDRVEAFKQALGITEMSWMSYDYASRDDSAG